MASGSEVFQTSGAALGRKVGRLRKWGSPAVPHFMPGGQVERQRLGMAVSLRLGPGRGSGLARADSEGTGRAQSGWVVPPTHPRGPFPCPYPPPQSWPGPIPQGLPRGQAWKPPKPNPRVTSKRLPGCSPLSSAPTTVISRPQLPQALWPADGFHGPELLPGASAQVFPRSGLPSLASTCPDSGPSLPPRPARFPPPWPPPPAPISGFLSPSLVVCPLWVPVGPGHLAIQAQCSTFP